MATTFLKRQKEMKRLEKQREKAERRAQKKIASRTPTEPPAENIDFGDNQGVETNIAAPSGSEPHN
jgi:hypothetical protein